MVQLVCNMVHLLAIRHSFNQIRDMPVRNDMVGRSHVLRQVLSHLMENERICRDVLRMSPSAFATLCDKLRLTGLLKNLSRSTIEEQVAKFLHDCRILGTMSKTHRKDNTNNFLWTDEFDNLLVDALLDEKMKGNRHDGTFTTQAYNNIMQVLIPILGSRLEKAHVKNRIKTLKKKFAECKDLFHGLSGFAWNAETCMFEATHEVWTALIQVKPSASKWMNKPVRNYGKLYDIYGEDRATGDGAESAREKVMRWQREGNLNLNDDSFVVDNEFSWTNDAPMDTNNMSPPSTHYSPTPTSEGGQTSKGKKRKALMIEAMEKQFDYVTESMNKVASVLQEGNAIMKESNMIAERAVNVVEKGRPRFYNEEEIYSAVHELGLHSNMQLDAYLFLINNNIAARSFFGTPPAMRAEVLMKMMNLL